jgi:hypothetical protein
MVCALRSNAGGGNFKGDMEEELIVLDPTES